MQKDHRLNPRRHVNLNVWVHVPGQLPFVGNIRNASIDGLFVETDAQRLARDAECFVAFELTVNGDYRRFRVPVHCMWQTNDGAGLMFTSSSLALTRALRHWLNPAPTLVHSSWPDNAGKQWWPAR